MSRKQEDIGMKVAEIFDEASRWVSNCEQNFKGRGITCRKRVLGGVRELCDPYLGQGLESGEEDKSAAIPIIKRDYYIIVKKEYHA